MKRYTLYISLVETMAMLLLYCISFAQCPSQQWDMANIGSAYVETLGNKAVYGNFSNLRDAQYVNDGNLYFFGDISNNGYLGDGFGYEFIKSCDNSITTISGQGFSEFNILDINNPGNVDLNKAIRIKTNLNFNNGIVHTDRTKFSERVFFIEGATHSGASDERHIDGSIGRQGRGTFVYPLGDGDHLSKLEATGEQPFDIFIATYHSTLQTEEQFNAKGVFSTDSLDLNISKVQPKEFWTLSGGQSTKVTLHWTEFSEIDKISTRREDLIVVGWDGEKWINLGNTGLTEENNSGSLTSSILIPNKYDAFTFGILDTDGDGYADGNDDDPFDPCVPDPSSEACDTRICVDVQLSVFLEGPMHSGRIGDFSDEMATSLNRFGYLPGQRPSTLLGTPASPGQPYNVEPWLYNGEEGHEFNVYANGGSQVYPRNVVDWVLVSLRTDPTVESTVCTKPALLLTNGDIFFTEHFDCCNMSQSEFYIVVEHRNHLPVMTPTLMPVVDGVISFDFRSNQSYTRLLGDGQKQIGPGRFAMFAGNGDQIVSPESLKDINANDISLWAMDNGRHSGYYFQDYDLSGDVNVHDKAIWLTNNGVFTDVDR